MNPSPDTFLGYPRRDGRVGTRNHCLVVCINGLCNRAARRAAAMVPGVVYVGHAYGRGQVGDDAAFMARTILGLSANPNVGHVIVVSGDRASVAAVVEPLRENGQSAEGVSLQDVGEDARGLSEWIVARAAAACVRLSAERRQARGVEHLLIGLQCGHSDYTSGLVANPVVGMVMDRVHGAGGTIMFGETVEWLGGEHNLARRARTAEVANGIESALAWRVRYALAHGEDVTRHNPLPQNIAGGLTTTEEKALGAIVKGGTAPIEDVLAPAHRPPGPGLYLMDTPFFSPESLTCLVAGGANITVFTTGPGNSYCSAVAPTVKVSANPDTCKALSCQVDLPLADATEGRISREEAAEGLYAHLLSVASGTRTYGEVLGEGDEVIGRAGMSL